MYKVILLRGRKETITYKHTDFKSAMLRAKALTDLHSAILTINSNELIVNADEYYGKG